MNQFNLLKDIRFLPLFCTQFLGALNDNLFKNALVILIAFTLADRLGVNGSLLIAITAGVFILPFFLFSAIAGQLADKIEKSCLIRRVKFAEIIIMCGATAGFYLQSVGLLITALFFMGVQSTLFGPLKYSILPQHLTTHELLGGNGMIQMGTYLAILLGTMIGGLLVAVDTYGPLYLSILLIIVAMLGWRISCAIPVADATAPTLEMRWNIVAESWRMIRYARENHTVFWAIIGISWFWFCGAIFLSLVPTYTRDVLNADEQSATLILLAFSIGIGGGALLCEKLLKQRITLILAPFGALGLTLFTVDLAWLRLPDLRSIPGPLTVGDFIMYPEHWHALFDFVMIGLMGGLYMVPLYALVQHLTHPDIRARVIAANNIMNACFMVFSAILIGLSVWLGATVTELFFIVAAGNVIMLFFIIAKEPKFLTDLTDCFFRCRPGKSR